MLIFLTKNLLVKQSFFQPHYIENDNLFFNTGDVLKIFYFLKAKHKKKLFFFIGICFAINYNNKNFKLFNYLHGERIVLTFSFYSPLILRIFKIIKYAFYFKKFKLYFIKKINLRDDDGVNFNVLSSSEKSYVYDLYDFVFPIYFKSKFFKKLLKKYR